ncbi:hypothetical protein FQR65_LT02450 [Abscondita terminalis]|nr:hypothetical protein FQR65_LT02450 [Abscondita terminalis]
MNALLVFVIVAVAAAHASLIAGPAALVGPAGLGLRGVTKTTLVGPSGSISTIDSGAIASPALLSRSVIAPEVIATRTILPGSGLIASSPLGLIDGGLGRANLIAPGILSRSILL